MISREQVPTSKLSSGLLILLALSLVMFSVPAFAQLTSDDIADLRAQGESEGWTFTVGENSATEYSLDQLCGMKVPDNWQENATFDDIQPTKALPVAFDWRDSSGVTVVKNQGGCGSCWAFATVGPLECNIKIKDGIDVDLSEQWLVSCNSNGWDCGGGWWAHDYHEWKTDPCGGTGTVSEADFPYTASNGTCNCPYDHHYLIESWAYIGNSYSIPSVAAMKQAIIDYGPIAVAVHANSAMQTYGGGIFNGCVSGGEINHGVTLVGWDDNQGTSGVWIMRNSWGTGWGEDGGYMRMDYGCSDIGYGACYVDYQGMAGLGFDYPGGIPTMVTPDEETTFDFVVSGADGGTPVSGSGRLHYSVNGASYVTTPMYEPTPNHYVATLPPMSCGDVVEFYVSADEVTTGTKYDPLPSSPNVAVAALGYVTIFEDDFETDKGWVVSGSVADGPWDRGVPVGGGERGDPANDFDGSGSCYLTDNEYGNSDVDDGTTTLISPMIDLSGGDAIIHYARWYSNNFGDDPNNDVMNVYISNNNASSWTLVETVGPAAQANGGWFEKDFRVGEYVTPTAQMRIRFDASDLGSGSVVEAAIDDVVVSQIVCGGSSPTIVTESVHDWTVNIPLSEQLEAMGGTGLLSWSDKLGELAGTGLALSTDGLLSGTPVTSGIVSFTARVEDEGAMFDEELFSFDINPALEITTMSLPAWTAGQAYNASLQCDGGTSPIVWSDKYSDFAPTGLTLNSDGSITGIPISDGTINFTAEADDYAGATDESPLSVTINAAVSINTLDLPDGTEGGLYSEQLLSAGGTGTINWIDKNGDLSGSGLVLSTSGLLSGIPNAVGKIDFTAEASDITGGTDEVMLSVDINRAFICGDANADDIVNILDVTHLISFLYMGGPTPQPYESGDVNGDGVDNILDVTYLINFLYNDGPEPNCL